MPDSVTITFQPPDLPKRMKQYGFRADVEMKQASDEAIKVIDIPPYPPATSPTYTRTGKLGRSLGSGMGGGRSGRADIQDVRRLGQGRYEFQFGSKLAYAPYVIDDRRQSRVMRGKGWWTMAAVLQRSQKGIQTAFDKVSQRMKNFIGGEVWR